MGKGSILPLVTSISNGAELKVATFKNRIIKIIFIFLISTYSFSAVYDHTVNNMPMLFAELDSPWPLFNSGLCRVALGLNL